MADELTQPGLELAPGTQRPVEPWDTMIATFLDTLEAKSTRDSYEPTLRALAEVMGTTGPAEVDSQELARWARSMREEAEAGDISPNTAKRRVMAVKSFYRFAYQVGQSRMGKDLRAFVLKPPKELVLKPFQVLNRDEQERMLAASTGQERRMLATMLYAGLRVSELCRLKAGDYYADEDGRRWLKVHGKGSKARDVPVGAHLLDELGSIGGNGRPMFASREGNGHYSRVRIFQIVQDALERAGIEKRISPHSLRHTAAMNWLKGTYGPPVPLPVIQKWLGHASLETTRKYLDHLEDGELHDFMP